MGGATNGLYLVLIAGLGAVHCVSPAAGLAQWLGWLGWSGQQWRALTATNSQGFAAGYAVFVNGTPPYSEERGAADFWLVTRTDRPAWVTVGDSLTTNSFPVRAGTGRVRVRAAYGGPVSLTIDPLPGPLAELPGATDGLWLCELSVEPFRANTVVFSDNATPAVAGEPDCVDGILLLSPPPAAAVHSLTSAPPAAALQPLRMTDGAVTLGGDGWYCLCHGESCDWPTYGMVGCDTVSMSVNGVEAGTPLLPKDQARAQYGLAEYPLRRAFTQTVANAAYPFIRGKVVFQAGACGASGGVRGAQGRLPSHEPDYADRASCLATGCTCEGGPVWHLGFSHGRVNTRNLTRITTGNNDADSTEHCLGLVWSAGGKTNLFSLLDANHRPFRDDLRFTTDKLTIMDGELVLSKKAPADMKPVVYLIKLHYSPHPEFDRVYDKLWVVVNSPDTQTNFNTWYTQNSNINWTTNLPKPFASITFSTNWLGAISPVVTNLNGSHWHPPEAKNSYMHHDARYEMRSKPTAGGHGHQASALSPPEPPICSRPILHGTFRTPTQITEMRTSTHSFAPYNWTVIPFFRQISTATSTVPAFTKERARISTSKDAPSCHKEKTL